jgi:hypothetical protein
MKFIADCAECKRLWRELAAATTEHIKLESKLSVAAIAHQAEAIIALTPSLEPAAIRRSAARESIWAHERDSPPEPRTEEE